MLTIVIKCNWALFLTVFHGAMAVSNASPAATAESQMGRLIDSCSSSTQMTEDKRIRIIHTPPSLCTCQITPVPNSSLLSSSTSLVNVTVSCLDNLILTIRYSGFTKSNTSFICSNLSRSQSYKMDHKNASVEILYSTDDAGTDILVESNTRIRVSCKGTKPGDNKLQKNHALKMHSSATNSSMPPVTSSKDTTQTSHVTKTSTESPNTMTNNSTTIETDKSSFSSSPDSTLIGSWLTTSSLNRSDNSSWTDDTELFPGDSMTFATGKLDNATKFDFEENWTHWKMTTIKIGSGCAVAAFCILGFIAVVGWTLHRKKRRRNPLQNQTGVILPPPVHLTHQVIPTIQLDLHIESELYQPTREVIIPTVSLAAPSANPDYDVVNPEWCRRLRVPQRSRTPSNASSRPESLAGVSVSTISDTYDVLDLNEATYVCMVGAKKAFTLPTAAAAASASSASSSARASPHLIANRSISNVEGKEATYIVVSDAVRWCHGKEPGPSGPGPGPDEQTEEERRRKRSMASEGDFNAEDTDNVGFEDNDDATEAKIEGEYMNIAVYSRQSSQQNVACHSPPDEART